MTKTSERDANKTNDPIIKKEKDFLVEHVSRENALNGVTIDVISAGECSNLKNTMNKC